MLLQINEREHQFLMDLLGRALRELREVDFGAALTERDALIVGLRERLLEAQASGLVAAKPESIRILV